MAKLWGKEITVDEQISLLEDFSSYLEVSMLVTIEKFKSIIILQKPGWLNVARDFLSDTLPEVCDEVGQYLVKSKLMNPPNWKMFLKDRLEIAKEAGQAIYSYHEKCFQICASQYQQQYQATYEQELAKQGGLGFGILSSSLAAHLVYAAQSARKEVENEKKASEAADKIMHSSLGPVEKAAQMTIAFYHEKFDPFVVEFLIGFYSDIEKLIYDGLEIDKEVLDNNKTLSSDELSNITEDNHRERIIASLSKYPFNGDALFWAVRYDDADDDLIQFCSANPLLLSKYLVAIEQSAVAYLKKQKEKADLYNRDPLTEDIVHLLKRIRLFLTDERMYVVSTYDNIIQEVYGEKIDHVCHKFDTLVKITKTPLALSNYAKSNKSIYIAKNDFETLVKYNTIFGTSKIKEVFDVIPDTFDAFDKMLSDLCETIQSENAKHQEAERQRQQRERELAEQKRREEEKRKEKERQAEIERQEQLKKKLKKVAIIVTPIVSALIIFIILLNSVIIPNGNYNKAVALMNDGKYEDAISAFKVLDGYKDSLDKISECQSTILDSKYNAALDLKNNKEYEQAISAFKALNGHRDSQNQIVECENAIINEAVQLLNNGNYVDAYKMLKKLETNSLAVSKLNECVSLWVDKALSSNTETLASSFKATVVLSSNQYASVYQKVTNKISANKNFNYWYDLKQGTKNAKIVCLLLQSLPTDYNSSISDYITFFDACANGKVQSVNDYLIDNYKLIANLWELDFVKNAVKTDDATFQAYLLGDWYTSDKTYYFKLTKKDAYTINSNYNLPSEKVDHLPNFFIKAFVYTRLYGLYQEGEETKDIFKFTIIDANKMDVYCYKNGTTYTLYRK